MRARHEGRDVRRLADSLEYGFVIHTYRRRVDPLVGRLDIALADSVRLSDSAFVRALRADSAAAPTADGITVLYVHGFGTSLHECWQYPAEAQIRSSARARWVAFCWPSNGAGVAPPSRRGILDGAYVQDSVAASDSKGAFVQAAQLVLDAVAPASLMLVAHSLGAQLMGFALRDSSMLRTRLVATPVRAIAFVSADVETTRFEEIVIPAVRPLASRIVVYTSARDRVLALSRLRSGTERAGLQRHGSHVFPALETIDATDGLVAEGRVQGVIGAHHAIRRASAVMFDLMHVVGARRAADCRTSLRTAVRNLDGIWRLTSVRPDTAAAARCRAFADAMLR